MKENKLENQSLRALEHDWKYLIPEQKKSLCLRARLAMFELNLLRALFVVMAFIFSLVTPLPRRRTARAQWV